jgi:hypothetical protein
MIAFIPLQPRMNSRIPTAALALLSALALWLQPALAGGDHDHDHGDAPATSTAAQALPRFSAVSEDFELVGVLNGQQLTLYLDRAATNEPVREASIELDVGGRAVQASPAPDGTFHATLPQALPEGSTPISATVIAGGTSDLLAGEIDIHDADHGDDAGAHAHPWRRAVAWGLGGLVAVGILALWWRKRAKPASRVGGAA